MEQSSTFLSLPRELRDVIYKYYIISHLGENRRRRRPRPVNPWACEDPRLYYRQDNGDNTERPWGEWWEWPAFRKRNGDMPGHWRLLGLVLVNRQIHREALDAINEYVAYYRPRAELDIDVDGQDYTPSWKHVDNGLGHTNGPIPDVKLDVNLIVHSTEAFRPPNQHEEATQQPQCGPIFHVLLDYLTRFLYHGAKFLDEEPPDPRGAHFITALSINVSFEDYNTKDTWPETLEEIFRIPRVLTGLDTAFQYIGEIRVSCAYVDRGQVVERVMSLDPRAARMTRMSALFNEADWARRGLLFGNSWLEQQKLRQKRTDGP